LSHNITNAQLQHGHMAENNCLKYRQGQVAEKAMFAPQ